MKYLIEYMQTHISIMESMDMGTEEARVIKGILERIDGMTDSTIDKITTAYEAEMHYAFLRGWKGARDYIKGKEI